jgi:ribosomal protein S18 acetylase RimI-like enzyme
MPGFGLRVIMCPPKAREDALEVLYRRVPLALRDRLIAEVLDEAERGEVDLSGLWVAREGTDRIVGALLTQALAGKAAGVWAPEVKPSWRRATVAAALVQAALADLKARGFQLAQAVLDESAGPYASRDLKKGGMPRVTELLYLERDTVTPISATVGEPPRQHGYQVRSTPAGSSSHAHDEEGSCPGFQWQPFSKALESDFRSVLQATYAGSLDMPELEGARALDDILEGHRKAGRFVAERWWLGHVHGKPEFAAILLMAEVPGRNAWEVIYLGLTPPARGQGLGRAVIKHALELARDRVPWLELAVDLRNTPALRLYEAAGFTARDRRAVHLVIFPATSTSPRGEPIRRV